MTVLIIKHIQVPNIAELRQQKAAFHWKATECYHQMVGIVFTEAISIQLIYFFVLDSLCSKMMINIK
jgi:hypothetical protein